MQIIVICAVIFFAQCTIIIHARSLQDTQAETKQNDQTNPVKDIVEFQAGRPLDILTEPTTANTVNPELTSFTQTQQIDVTSTSTQGTIITQARPLQDTQANIKENTQNNPVKDVAEFQTATPLDKLTATIAANTVDPESTTSTQTQQIDVAVTSTQGIIITQARPLQDIQENAQNNPVKDVAEFQTATPLDKLTTTITASTVVPESTTSAQTQQIYVTATSTQGTIITQARPLQDTQANTKENAQNNPVKDVAEFQTATPLDKLTATTTANTVDPESTTSTQTQQIDVTDTSTTANRGLLGKISDFFRRELVVEFQTARPLDKPTATTTANTVYPQSTTSTQAQHINVKATSTTANRGMLGKIFDFFRRELVVEFQTARPLDKLTATTTANTVDPQSTTSTQAQHIDVTATSTTANRGRLGKISDFFRREHVVEFQTATSPLDKLTATTVDPESTTSTQTQQTNVSATSKTAIWGRFRKISDFFHRNTRIIGFTGFIVGSIIEFISAITGENK